MSHEHFNMKEHGFVGHLAEPDGGSDRAVLVIMGESKVFFRVSSLLSVLQIMELPDYPYRPMEQKGCRSHLISVLWKCSSRQ